MSVINAGEMRTLLTWQTYVEPTGIPPKGSFGQDVENWVTQGQHWAKVEPMTGTEIWNARQKKALSDTKITMRNVGPIKPADRFLLGTRVFTIDSVSALDEVSADLVIEATELKNK